MTKQPTPTPSPVLDFRREMATLRATEAPVIFFEAGSSYGVRNGVANLTPEGGIHLTVDGQSVNDVSVVAHLRFPVSAIPSLRAALDGIENMLTPVPETQEAADFGVLRGASNATED